MSRNTKLRLIRSTQYILQNWIKIFLVIFALFNILPFIAPILAQLGINPLADLIYTLYAPLCHQMAQRSFFLFGDQIMYSPEQLPLSLTGDPVGNMLALKHFTGSDILGWKVAWSDRMVYMYGATWAFALVYATASRRYRIKRLPLWAFVFLMLPMVLDGTTHMFSDLNGGLFSGFRYTNEWLANLTDYTLPEGFYVGDSWGAFNSWMRLISGLGFGVAIIGLTFPVIDNEMQYQNRILTHKLQKKKQSEILK